MDPEDSVMTVMKKKKEQILKGRKSPKNIEFIQAKSSEEVISGRDGREIPVESADALAMHLVVNKESKRKSSSYENIFHNRADRDELAAVTPCSEQESVRSPLFKSKFAAFVSISALISGVLLVTCFIVSILAMAEISSFKLELASLQETLDSPSTPENISLIRDLLSDQDQLLQFLRDVPPGFFPVSSCASLPPSSPSGYYWVRTLNGSAVRVYCDMTRSCGNITGGWMRVEYLDMTDSNQQCPTGLVSRNESDPKRTCASSSSPDCSSVVISIPYSYSRVCGRVIAYQVGATNAFRLSSSDTIEDNYVDGVSLTHGTPREHIWTFAVGLQENGGDSACPCAGSPGTAPPSFIKSDYFCEAGIESYERSVTPMLYSNDPLWDGDGCIDTNPCCSFNNPPWFYKQLPQPTTDDIEMRVCRDEDASNEDVAIEIVEIYVQ